MHPTLRLQDKTKTILVLATSPVHFLGCFKKTTCPFSIAVMVTHYAPWRARFLSLTLSTHSLDFITNSQTTSTFAMGRSDVE